MNESEIIASAWATGHFWNPDNPNGLNVKQADLGRLKITDSVVRDAIQSRSLFQAHEYAEATFEQHGRAPYFDGENGPAVQALFETPRCHVPDYAPPPGAEFAFEDEHLQKVCEDLQASHTLPAIGRGNWKGCHDVGDFHSVSVRVNRSGIGRHLEPHFKTVLGHVREAYRRVGLLIHFIEDGKDIVTGEDWSGRFNIEFTFVGRSRGWIGLAIVGTNQGCGSNIWCRYLSTYRPGNIVNEWTTLIKHELGHNCGTSHTRGGVMNPGIVRGLPLNWTPSDPLYGWLRRQFGGVAVGDDRPDPGPDPEPPTQSLEDRVKELESDVMNLRIQGAARDALIRTLIAQKDD